MRDPPQRDFERSSKIKARTPFDWWKYLLGRAVGVLPIFWLSLIVGAPRWKENDDGVIQSGRYSRTQADECIALYIIAMESWVRPQCEVLGVNTSLYGSIIFNVFLMYCAFRMLFSMLQNRLMNWRTSAVGTEKKSYWNRIGDTVTMLTYNRPCPSVAVGFTITLFSIMSGILLMYTFIMPWKNAITFFPFFLLGLTSANLVECIHWASWNQHISLDSWTEEDIFPTRKAVKPGKNNAFARLVLSPFE